MIEKVKDLLLDDDWKPVSRKLDKRDADEDEEKPPAKKGRKKKKSPGEAAQTSIPPSLTTGSTTTGSTTTGSPTTGSPSTEHPGDKSATTTTGNPDSKLSKKGSPSLDNDDPDSSTMQNLMKNQRVEKKLLDKAYQALKDYVGFVETHDKMVLNPVSASQMVSYVNALVPKYLTRSYSSKNKKVAPLASTSDDSDYPPVHPFTKDARESRRYQFTRLGY